MEKDLEILEEFRNNHLQRDKFEIDNRCGGFKMGKIYKLTELNPALEHLIQAYKEQQAEPKKKDKIIDKMAEMINNYDIDEDICKQMGDIINCNEFADEEECKKCIKQYFERKADDIK